MPKQVSLPPQDTVQCSHSTKADARLYNLKQCSMLTAIKALHATANIKFTKTEAFERANGQIHDTEQTRTYTQLDARLSQPLLSLKWLACCHPQWWHVMHSCQLFSVEHVRTSGRNHTVVVSNSARSLFHNCSCNSTIWFGPCPDRNPLTAHKSSSHVTVIE